MKKVFYWISYPFWFIWKSIELAFWGFIPNTQNKVVFVLSAIVSLVILPITSIFTFILMIAFLIQEWKKYKEETE